MKELFSGLGLLGLVSSLQKWSWMLILCKIFPSYSPWKERNLKLRNVQNEHSLGIPSRKRYWQILWFIFEIAVTAMNFSVFFWSRTVLESSEPKECDKWFFQDDATPLTSFQSQEPHTKIILKQVPRPTSWPLKRTFHEGTPKVGEGELGLASQLAGGPASRRAKNGLARFSVPPSQASLP